MNSTNKARFVVFLIASLVAVPAVWMRTTMLVQAAEDLHAIRDSLERFQFERSVHTLLDDLGIREEKRKGQPSGASGTSQAEE